jgi:branched-chain amino acid transport system substrate-binding protein
MNQHNKSLRLSRITVIFFSLFIILQLLVGVHIIFKSPDPIIISYGEENLFPELSKENPEYKDKKQKGIKSIINRAMDDAIYELCRYLYLDGGKNNSVKECLETSINPKKRDPEALIYLNNAKIEAKKTKTDKIYTIAVPVPIAQQPNKSLEILRGVAQAQNEFSCQSTGQKNFFLKVAIISDENNPKTAKEVAKKLTKEPNILGVVGHLSSSLTLAARDIYNDKKLVAITPTSTSVKLSEQKNSENYVFRTVPSDKLAAEKLGKYMLETLKKRKAAVFYTKGNSYSESLKESFENYVTKKKETVLSNELSDLSKSFFSPVDGMKWANKENTEVLMLAPHDDDTLNKVLLLIYKNNKKFSLLGGDSVYSNKILQEGEGNVEGMVLATAWHIDVNPDSDFVEKSNNLWGGEVSWRTALAYDATQALIEAIKKEPTRSGVRNALISDNFKFVGASGNVQFEKNGDRKNAPVHLVKIVVDPENQGKYKFQPIPEQ